MNDTLYLVIPCYNEEEVLHETAKRLIKKITTMIEDEFISKDSKILFVNDGSKDKTIRLSIVLFLLAITKMGVT